jgi:ADP-ribose pyrophosphatase YjhB (NUDIX family)
MRCRPALILVERNHMLLMKYQYGTEFVYNLPGGNPDPGETLVETIVRECREELDIEVEVGNLLMVGEILPSEKRDASVHILFEGKIISGIPVIQKDQTSALELVWVSISEITKINMYPNVSAELQDLLFLQKPGKYVGAIPQAWF